MFAPQAPKRIKSKIGFSETRVPNELIAFRPVPSHEQISQRAYEIHQSSGYAHGRDQQDWFKAEQEMFARRK